MYVVFFFAAIASLNSIYLALAVITIRQITIALSYSLSAQLVTVL
jgi:hypothetical protein